MQTNRRQRPEKLPKLRKEINMPGSHENRLKAMWPESVREASEESASDALNEKVALLKRRLERRMAEYSGLSLATAAILGFMVGWMVKRK